MTARELKQENIQGEVAPSILPQKTKKKRIKPFVLVILAALVIVGVFWAGYKVGQISQPVEKLVKIQEETAQPLQKKIYFGIGKGEHGVYSLVDLLTGVTKEFIPSGYEIVAQHRYEAFSEFLILKKENQLFSYSLINKNLRKIDIELLKDSEVTVVFPSISDKSKFYLLINDTETIEAGLYHYKVIGSRKYFFDAYNNQIQKAGNVKASGCYQYDSEHSRFFTWPCGEGIGASIPFKVYNYLTGEEKEVVGFQDFGLDEKGLGLISVCYNNGYFLMIPKNKGDFSKIIVIKPENEIVKKIYKVTEKVKSELRTNKVYPYSALLVEAKRTIVIGGSNFMLFLHFDNAKKEITNVKYLEEKEVYANFIFTDGEKLYYRSGDKIKIVNLSTQQVEKAIPFEGAEEITIFSF